MKTSLQNDNRGIAHLLIIVLVVVVLGGIGFAGWWVFVKNKSEPATLQNASPEAQAAADTAKSACMTQYNDKELCNFIAVQAATPFDQTSTVITMSGSSVEGEIVIQSDGKGNSYTTMTSNGEAYNYIVLDNITYFQYENGGSWYTYGASDDSEDVTSIESGLDSIMNSLSTTSYTKVGQEACGSLTCLKYQVTETDATVATYYIWFDTSDYLMRKFYQSDADGEYTMTIAYQAVTISKPSPVEDMSSMYDSFDY